MITEIIDEFNAGFVKLFEKKPDVKIYGLAQPVQRIQGTVVETLPCLVDKNGEATYVGFDDTYPLILYHKINSVTSKQTDKNGRGDLTGDIITTFNNVIIVYMDRKRINAMPDEVALAIQANIPDGSNSDNRFRAINVLFQGVILDSTKVFASEYQSTEAKGLDPGKSMLAVGYLVEATYQKGCFSECLS